MFELNLKALAKINLGLDVIGKREDGYHEVKMVMQTIHLYDKIQLRKTKEPGIKVQTNLFYLPANENNLVYKAAKLLMDEFQIKEGVNINLEKFIPVAAGMAGGSSVTASACSVPGLWSSSFPSPEKPQTVLPPCGWPKPCTPPLWPWSM